MRGCLFICLMAASLAITVKSKPHGKHHGQQKTSHMAKEKDVFTEEANDPQVLPTLATFRASSQEQEVEELSSEGNANAKTKDEEVTETGEKSTAVLLSEEELVDLLKKEAEEEEEEEEKEEEEEEEEETEAEAEEAEAGERAQEDEEAGEDTRIQDKETEGEEKKWDKALVTEAKRQEEANDGSLDDEVVKEVKKMPLRSAGKNNGREEKMVLLEEPESSTESEIPADLDYASDSGILQPVEIESAKIDSPTNSTQSFSKEDIPEHKKSTEKEVLSIGEVYDQDMQNTEAVEGEEVPDPNNDKELSSKEISIRKKSNMDPQEPKSSAGLESSSQLPGKEEEQSKNESGNNNKGKTRKQKKNQRARKHSPQRDESHPAQEQSQQDHLESEGNKENKVHKTKRRRAGKWGPLVGVNPVQIRGAVDLYPESRSSFAGAIYQPSSPPDPCDNFRCKRGKTCKLDADSKPSCVCQEPAECPRSVNEFDHVCGTDNQTYDTSCELFATKCNLEGTKRGQRLHLDYTGSCKLIPLCVETELIQFPLRMRDWLKNVLLQLYEQDTVSSGFLTPKQRFRVKKIFENERRLQAGDHSVELLVQDFEKNYNMYIYPVHWQFAQLDQHPSDRFLSHSELAPLRVPLVPMEHCTSLFFQECDADKDKQVSFKEWTTCFGIKNDDMDVNLLF
ncbi:unnamed protein product [Menidia menidia]|uniref:(Atlantic silverside) hypothetical protein n=1 Tax=Menidia menidia TaxID=238744 RepID=A0A8S4BAX2_9TELE|nr:unnamed protein product [Menidia menidia]